MRPSTGFFSVILALQLCRKVSLFGLTTDPCQPFHYYGAAKPSCTHAIPPENDESVHWFEKVRTPCRSSPRAHSTQNVPVA